MDKSSGKVFNTINMIVSYPVDSVIHLWNNPGQNTEKRKEHETRKKKKSKEKNEHSATVWLLKPGRLEENY